MIENEARFQQLVDEAMSADFQGWDFSWLDGRAIDPAPFWDYKQLVQSAMEGKSAMLDMGTGGGEFLASFAPFDLAVSATEHYPPNILLAQDCLEPLGVNVYPLEHETQLPIPDNSFDLVINRHESYDIHEVRWVLRPGGVFLTQQVGGANDRELVRDMTGTIPEGTDWHLSAEIQQVQLAGFEIRKQAERHAPQLFFDIGAVVYYLRAIAWLVPDFDPATYRPQLAGIHRQIQRDGSYGSTSHRFLIEAGHMEK